MKLKAIAAGGMTLLLGGAALVYAGGASLPGFQSAPAAQADAEENAVSASWKLAVASLDDVEGQVNPAGAGTVSCNIKNLTFAGTGNYIVSNGTFSYSKINMVDQTGGRVDDQYIEFTFTPSVSFTPTGFSFDIMNDGWGDGRYEVEVIRGEQTELLVPTATPLRNNDADNQTTSSFTVSQQFTSFPSSEEAVTLRIYLFARNAQSSRNMGLANVTISGLTGDVVLEPSEDELLARKNFIPGTLDITTFDHDGSNPRYQDDNKNIGYCKPNEWMSIGNVTCDRAGVYQMELELYRYGDYGMQVTILDAAGEAELDYTWNFPSIANQTYTPVTVLLPGELSAGQKTVKLTFLAPDGTSWVCNFRAPSFRKVADHLAQLTGVSCGNAVGEAYEGVDWNVNLSRDLTDANVVLTLGVENATIAATATSEGENYDITVGTNTLILPTPEQNQEVLINVALTPAGEGTLCAKENYTIRLFRLGELSLTGVSIDGMELPAAVLAQLNEEPYEAELTDWVFTTLPAVTATSVDGSAIVGQTTGAEGNKAVYTFHATLGDTERDYKLTLGGVHIYTPEAGTESISVKYAAAGKTADGNWTNGLFTLSPCNDGWDNSSFKMGEGDITWTIPAGYVVKSMIMHDFNANYNGGTLTSVTSEGATVYLPTRRDYQEPDATMYNLVVNFDNFTAGAPIVFNLQGGGQPVAWFEFIVEKTDPKSAPVLTSTSTTFEAGKNHGIVTLAFDREMASASASVADQTVTAQGGASTLSFLVWDLPYEATSKFTIPAGTVKDTFGNAYGEEISIDLEVAAKAAVAKHAFDYVVMNAEEFSDALAAVNKSNASADAEPVVIFMLNGNYDFEEVEQQLRAYNVSFIGESREGVVIRGNRTGISNPVFSTRYSTNTYMQDFTVRNDYDWGKERAGVAVAHYGGARDIMKNVELQSQQDTQVTGSLGYYEECVIHGSTDYICGGGDQYYYNCQLLMTTDGGVIAAPNTSSLNKWGYVFESCTIDQSSSALSAVKTYNLGRPWQNEPRAYFLNTKMNVLASAAGWTTMGSLPTHFYEYKSVDANGNLIDLSTRKNSPTHVGDPYTPVLSDDEAALFTLHNVLGSNASWLPTEDTEAVAAPAVTAQNGLAWEEVEGASCYVIFLNGSYLDNTTDTNYLPAKAGVYTVRAANVRGGLGAVSNAIDYDPSSSSGVDTVATDDVVAIEYYTLQGVRTLPGEGVLIRVETLSDGSKRSSKIIVRK